MMENTHHARYTNWLQKLGLKHKDGNIYVFDWGEVTKEFGLSLGILKFDDPPHYALHIQLPYPNIFITIPYIIPKYKCVEMMDAWGIKYLDQALHLNWGHKTKIISMPWEWVFYKEIILAHNITTDYTYILSSGKMQHRIATFNVVDRIWVWRISKRLGLLRPKKVYKCIDIEFNDEIGERTGTWKGGVTATTFEMKPNESPLKAIDRMEREYRC